MPRTALGVTVAMVVAGLVSVQTVASDDSGNGTCSDKDQTHVDFSIGSDGTNAGTRGQGHVDFSVAGDKGQGHVDFRVNPLGAYALEARLLPGECGAGLWLGCSGGDGGDGQVDVRIGIRPDGRVDVNGEAFAVCDPAVGCWISVSWSPETNALVVQVEEASGDLCAAQFALPVAPSEIHVTAAEVGALSVTSQ